MRSRQPEPGFLVILRAEIEQQYAAHQSSHRLQSKSAVSAARSIRMARRSVIPD